ncbi:MAG: CHAD domain-containing protein [Caldilineales bacterium]|nr:CHAD domain-containing protein [Caldilineales bacterium]
MASCVRFNLPAGWEVPPSLTVGSQSATVQRIEAISGRLTVLDTFDWRLFREGLALYQLASGLTLCSLGGEEAAQEPGSLAPRFVAQLPKGELRKRLKPVAGVRALLPMAAADYTDVRYRVLDGSQSSLAEMALLEARHTQGPDDQAVARQLWVWSSSGSVALRRRLVAALGNLGLERVKDLEDDQLYARVLEWAGQRPGSYSTQLALDLDPDMPAADAVRLVLRELLRTMQLNEPYVVEDVDIEFLHDYRVALRRTRSLLAQMKHIFPPDEVQRFRQAFAELGEQTNALRDLDVYLARQKDYTRLLPAHLRPAIAPLFDHLRSLRSEALAAVVSALTSPEHARLMAEWQAFLDQPSPDHPQATHRLLPIGVLARQRLLKRYRGMAKQAAKLARDASPQTLHALRIEGKKLRYLLEVFASLFPAKKVHNLVDHLKQLQDILGDINDLTVQEAYLQQVAQDLPLDGVNGRNTLLAVGVLIGKLDDQREALRAQVGAALAEFTAAETAELVAELFEQEDEEED